MTATLPVRAGADEGVAGAPDIEVLDEIARRVLWLAVRIVDSANHDRDNSDGIKVGGHQASSASMVSAMTALWFAHLSAADKVSVKPHASPVFHAIQYLLGRLDASYLTTLRARGGLQSYPSRTKDPEEVDFSTGSVGLGVASPLFADLVRRYVDDHFGARPRSRFIAFLGDAELDEGNIWEAVFDAATAGLGNTMWVVDFNRQSLDRVVPGMRLGQWRGQFEAAGWHVVEVKYGARLTQAFARPGGAALRRWLDAMPNEHYQSTFGLTGDALRQRFLDGAPADVVSFVESIDVDQLPALLGDLGGHSMAALLAAYQECDAVADRPSVVFAYTVKGWGLPIAGNPRNHSALLTTEQVDELRVSMGLTRADEWARLSPSTPAGALCERRARELRRTPRSSHLEVEIPVSTGLRVTKALSTQEAFGRALVDLSRNRGVAPYLVTTAPDVATSTNLAGFINRMGVYALTERRAWSEDPMLRWAEGPHGQHLELGIAEMNLFLLLGQLGLAWDLSGQPLLPIGTVYDPFVCRGLDAFVYAVYSGSRFVVAGTPAGVTLSPEGGAHQSTITASIGLELPNVTALEPAYATALDWLLCDALGRIASGEPTVESSGVVDRGAYYFRLTTRPLDQAPFEAVRRRVGDDVLRRQVLSGGYRLVEGAASDGAGGNTPEVTLVGLGAVLPEVLEAAAELADEGIGVSVVDVTSGDRLYRAWQHSLRQGIRSATRPVLPSVLRELFPGCGPLVTVHDGASHAMSWLGSALGRTAVPLGVDEFGQTGTIGDLYEIHDLTAGSVVNAALAALSLDGR
ncbi:MAG: transketolase-like TK C-terminal-containing protein [Nocardioidaceae bacterium]